MNEKIIVLKIIFGIK